MTLYIPAVQTYEIYLKKGLMLRKISKSLLLVKSSPNRGFRKFVFKEKLEEEEMYLKS